MYPESIRHAFPGHANVCSLPFQDVLSTPHLPADRLRSVYWFQVGCPVLALHSCDTLHHPNAFFAIGLAGRLGASVAAARAERVHGGTSLWCIHSQVGLGKRVAITISPSSPLQMVDEQMSNIEAAVGEVWNTLQDETQIRAAWQQALQRTRECLLRLVSGCIRC